MLGLVEKKQCIITVAAMFVLLLTAVSHADIYRFVDKDGVIHLANVPKSGAYKRVMKEPAPPAMLHYDRIIQSKSAKYNLDPSLIRALITAESNWDSKAISQKGAIGLMQIMPETASDMQISNPFDPEQNIEAGSRYIRLLLDRFDGDLELAIAAYNAGPSTVERAGGIPRITETRQFLDNVLSLHDGRSSIKPSRIYRIKNKDGSILFTNIPPL